MIVRDEQRERVIGLLASHLLETGLAKTSLRQLATAAAVSDRMLLYYFADKTEILASTTERVAGELALKLAEAIPGDACLPPIDLLTRATALIMQASMRPYMRLWVEIAAAAARQEAPFVDIARQIMAGFMGWLESRLEVDDDVDREAVAAMILAAVDGLVLVDICGGAALAARAARAVRHVLA